MNDDTENTSLVTSNLVKVSEPFGSNEKRKKTVPPGEQNWLAEISSLTKICGHNVGEEGMALMFVSVR